jgi:aspartyl-tRNA(Asn)/glutamyl-tRNA(Gln) amidotransferase subunit B
MPELPDERVKRFISEYQLSNYDANILSADSAMATFFEQVVEQSNNAKVSANWVMGDVSAALNNVGLSFNKSPVTASQLAGLVVRIDDNSISGKMAKQVFEAMWQGEGSADEVIQSRGLKQVSDSGALEKLVAEVLDANPAMVQDYLSSEEGKRKKKLGGFMGQIMKASKGQANPQQVTQILVSKLEELL